MEPPTIPSNGDSCPPKELPHKVEARRRVRAARRDGPPQLQFVTATDLSQFRDTDAKRSVRSQAMIYHRSRSMINSAIDKLTAGKAHPRRHGKGSMKKGPTGTEQVRSTERQDKDRPSVAFEPGLGTISPALTCVTSDDEGRGWSTAVTLRQNPRDQQYVKLAQETAWSTPESEDRISNLAPDVTVDYDDSYDQQVARNARARKTIPRATGRVVDYEYTDTQEERQTRRLIDKLVTIPCFGNAFDAFGLLPRYKNPAVDSLLLMRMFMRTFATDGLLAKWFQGGPNRDILLSAYLITSAWVDMRTGCPEESTRTTIAKMETLSIASERLSQPGTQLDNTTLIVLMHLLAGEAWGCNEKTLRTHQYGIVHLISQRGGLSSLGTPGFAELCASGCYNTDIVCEAKPLPIFRVWEPPKYNAVDHGRPIPESPIFCPWLDFVTIPHDSGCSAVTCALLQDMRDLTNLFLSHNKMSGASRATSSVDADYKAKAAGIRKRLISLPSAHIPGLTTSNDWIYEACRLAALIYAASIMLRLPFSVTADPRCNPLAIETEFFSSPDAGRHLRTTRLSDALYDVLNRTDLNNVWGNMSGVLYWVCTVGAVAARSPTTLDMKRRQSPTATEAKAMWIRRCLTLTSLRIVVVLVFDHAIPIVRAQKTLLKVQELIGTYDGATSTVIELHAHEEMKRTPPMP
ncbi:hypothetical protein PTMSG1_07158 [Pyrenophora teres f. maculata]|nr:hypothetical protein PTMSG1_07158 [Pyrenophora teres f. maculata]